MKNLRLSIAYLAMLVMIFTSCSKEETGADVNPEKATLSFGAIVNDLINSRAAEKQSVGDIPDCSDDVPAYVSVVLSRDGSDVVGSDNDPFEIQLVDGQIFTEEVTELQLNPDIYSLEHFAVYNDDDEVIWIAPRTGSNLGGWINNPLPLSINLQAGVKKYVEVPVLCFDNRNVNEYGYVFFELLPTEAVEFCFFANYCPPNSGGRHYTASYSVSIWSGTTAAGDPIYTSVENETGQYDNGDYYAEPLCFALPTNDDMDEKYLYYEVTLLDWPGNYGTVTPNTVLSGTLSMNDIAANFNGDDNVDYEHLRFGCGDDGGNPPVVDTDQDGVPDANDDCPTVPGPASNKGCPEETDGDADGDGVTDSIDQCEDTPAGTEVDAVGCPVEDGDADGDGVTDSIDQCDNTPAGTEVDAVGCPVDTACVYEEGCDIEDVNSSCFIGGINNNLDFHLVDEQTNLQLNHAIQNSTATAILGYIKSSYDNNDNLIVELTANEGFSLNGYVLEVRPVDPTTGEMSETCREISCTNDAPGDTVSETFVNVQEGEKYYVRLNAVICPDDMDNDGTPDATDVCPQHPGPASNFGCPIDTECVFEEECDIADAEPSCVTLVTQSGDFNNPDFVLVSTHLSGVGLYDLEGWATNYGVIYSELNDEGNLEVRYQDVYGTVPVSSIVIEVRPAAPGTFLMSETCREIICSTDVSAEDVFVFNNIRTIDQYYYLRVKAVACPPDTDLDGVPDALDACPQVPGPASNSGCPE